MREGENNRQTNMELLRIIAMILIVAHHYALYSGFRFSGAAMTVNRMWVRLLQVGGKIGVNIFVLISGYFLITSERVKISKILKFELQILFYALGGYLYVVVAGQRDFSFKALFKSMFPVTFQEWNYVSAYFVLYLLSPYINRFLRMLEKRAYQQFLMLLMLIWCVIPTLTAETFQCNYLLWMVFLYSLAGYIRLYTFGRSWEPFQYIACAAALIVVTWLSSVAMDWVGFRVPFFKRHATHFYNAQAIPSLLSALLLFLGFCHMKVESATVNAIAHTTFGVFLIHENRYLRPLIWSTWLQGASFEESRLLIPHSILAILVVFVAGALVELVRGRWLERRYMNRVRMLSDWISRKLEDATDVAAGHL